MKRRDIVIIGFFVVLSLGLWAVNFARSSGKGTQFVAELHGTIVLRKPLSAEGFYPIEQADGAVNIIEVKDGYVFMREANCRDGLCLRQGRTNTPAKSIICLPHGVTVSVLRSEDDLKDGLDIIVQ